MGNYDRHTLVRKVIGKPNPSPDWPLSKKGRKHSSWTVYTRPLVDGDAPFVNRGSMPWEETSDRERSRCVDVFSSMAY